MIVSTIQVYSPDRIIIGILYEFVDEEEDNNVKKEEVNIEKKENTGNDKRYIPYSYLYMKTTRESTKMGQNAASKDEISPFLENNSLEKQKLFQNEIHNNACIGIDSGKQ